MAFRLFFSRGNFGKTFFERNRSDFNRLTAEKLVDEGKVKHFILSGNNSGNTKLVSWMKKNGTKISADPYSTEKQAQPGKE